VDEDARRSVRERTELLSDRVGLTNRIGAVLATLGVNDYNPLLQSRIIYQLHIGTWWAVDATGAQARASRGGRFLDVATRLGYLRDLGITAVQLLPIQEFETEFSEGYNGVDYFSPEQRYQVGDDADLARYLGQVNATLAKFGAEPLTLEELRPGVNQLKCLIDLAHLHGV